MNVVISDSAYQLGTLETFHDIDPQQPSGISLFSLRLEKAILIPNERK